MILSLLWLSLKLSLEEEDEGDQGRQAKYAGGAVQVNTLHLYPRLVQDNHRDTCTIIWVLRYRATGQDADETGPDSNCANSLWPHVHEQQVWKTGIHR
jgi:hypothetical protein